MEEHGMTVEEFRAAGHAMVDFICEYRSKVAEYPVRSKVDPVRKMNSISSNL